MGNVPYRDNMPYRVTDSYIKNNPEFSIHGLGYHHINTNKPIHRVRGTDYYTILMLHTPGYLGDAFVDAHSFVIMSPNKRHFYGNKEISWDDSWLICHGSFMEKILSTSKMILNTPYSINSATIFDKYIKLVADEIKNNYTPNITILKNLFNNFICELQRATGVIHHQIDIPQKYLTIKNYIDTAYHENITLDTLAEKTGISKFHFLKEFKKYLKDSPIQYLMKVRMAHAVYHLENLNTNISEIAEYIGYKDIYYFSRTFKKYYGISPLRYRKQYMYPVSDSQMTSIDESSNE